MFVARLFLGALLVFGVGVSAPLAAVPVGTSCVGLRAPVDAELIHGFQPVGRYDGHWGIDFDRPTDPRVRAAASGIVSYAGTVVDNRTVTIDHGGGLKTSYSYLDEIVVRRGMWMSRGAVVGSVGSDSDHGAVHLSVRIEGRYVDPEPMLGCRLAAPSRALRLVGPP